MISSPNPPSSYPSNFIFTFLTNKNKIKIRNTLKEKKAKLDKKSTKSLLSSFWVGQLLLGMGHVLKCG